jgi:glycosyltransferase involved in cell wall biosynthesis
VEVELTGGTVAPSAALSGADLYLDLSRRGGFSRDVVDAVDAGLAIVALDNGARRDWLDEGTGYPIRAALAPLGRNFGSIPGSTPAPRADRDAVAAALASALASPAARTAKAAAAAGRVESLYGRLPAAARLLRELDRIRLRLAARTADSASASR